MGDRPAVLVTGAAGDIGRATAVALARRGWAVGLADLPAATPELGVTADACRAAGAPVWTGTFDVTDPARVHDGVEECRTRLGPITGLFANAGVQGPFERIDRYPMAEARTVLEVNVLGVVVTVGAVAAAMIGHGSGGAIVCTASMAGVSGAPNMAAYSASKGAVVALAKSAAKDLAPFGIRVNAVSPAFIGPGRMWDNQVARQAASGSQYYPADPAATAERMIASIPLRRYGSLEEVAAAVAFLLSADASYVTGVNLEIAGGAA